jgi:hypothetical protein
MCSATFHFLALSFGDEQGDGEAFRPPEFGWVTSGAERRAIGCVPFTGGFGVDRWDFEAGDGRSRSLAMMVVVMML